MNISLFSSLEDFVEASAHVIADTCEAVKPANIAISGGDTPRPIYEYIMRKRSWAFYGARFFLVDEKYVPRTHRLSNYRLAEETIGKRRDTEIVGFDTALSAAQAMKQYEQELKVVPEQSFDLTVVGIGHDGHIASLFPFSPALKTNKKLFVHTRTEQFPIPERLTMTFSLIMKSKKILVLLSGKRKRGIIGTILANQCSVEDFPAMKLYQHPNVVIHYLT